jgi:hypothetical protein
VAVAPDPVAAASAPIDAAVAARTLDAAPTAAGTRPAVDTPAPAPVAVPETARPARKVQARPSPEVSAAVAAAQQKADSFLRADAEAKAAETANR